MKTHAKIPASPAKRRSSFFGKGKGEDFFSSGRHAPAFFSKAPTYPNAVQAKCDACEKDELQKKPIFESEAEHVQRNPVSSEPATASPSIEKSLQSSKGSGSPLPNATRQRMESGFGADFSAVRIHDDTSARQMSKGLNAQAFTHGNDIYFNSGKYDTNSKGGQRLLAHELTHVVQQGKNVVRRYGQDNYCKDDQHLKPFIWPGHHKAIIMLQNTIAALGSNDPTLAQRVPQFFGKQGMAHLSEILTAYTTILNNVNGNYNYHCNDSSNNNPNAKKCTGERAETDLNNAPHDITLCFDVINSSWSDVDVGALIIHENWHRAFGSSSHPWVVSGNPPNCANNTNAMNSNLLIDNPDSYACMAILYA